MSYLADMNGYFDIPLALLCVLPLFVRSTGWRLAAAAVATVLGILIHEQFFFAFLPLLAVSVLFGGATAKSAGERRLAWAGAALLLALGLGLMLNFLRLGSVSLAQSEQLRQSIARSADRPLYPEVFETIPVTPRENLQVMKLVWRRPTYLPAQVEGLLLFGPTTVVLSWATLLLLRRWMPGRYRWPYAGVLLATLAPLSLHLLGWDKNRWNQLLCLNAFLLLLTVSKLAEGEAGAAPLVAAPGVPAGDAAEHGVGRGDAGRQPYAAVPVYAQPGCGSLVQRGTACYSSISTLTREAICPTCYRTARSCEFAGQPALFFLCCLPIMWRTRCVGR